MSTKSPVDPWVICPKPQPGARLRLFCFAYAGGGASVYHKWAQMVPAAIEVCLIQLPGRENRLDEPPLRAMTPLVQQLGAAIEPYLNKPCAFFGHSMGALVSFELARALRESRQRGPSRLCVSGCRAPQFPVRDEQIHDLPDQAFLDELRRLNGTPEAALRNDDLMRLMLPMLRADFAVCETYRFTPDQPLDCPLSAFGGLQDARISQAQIAGWREHTRGTFRLRMMPGDHFFVTSAGTMVIHAVLQDLAPLLRPLQGRYV